MLCSTTRGRIYVDTDVAATTCAAVTYAALGTLQRSVCGRRYIASLTAVSGVSVTFCGTRATLALAGVYQAADDTTSS